MLRSSVIVFTKAEHNPRLSIPGWINHQDNPSRFLNEPDIWLDQQMAYATDATGYLMHSYS